VTPKLKLTAKSIKRIVALCYVRQSITLSEAKADDFDEPDTDDGVPLPAKKRGPDLDSPERQKANIQAVCDRKRGSGKSMSKCQSMGHEERHRHINERLAGLR